MPILYFNEMTIGELLTFTDTNDFCDEKLHFLKFGKDWKAAYEALKKNGDWMETVRSEMSMGDAEDKPGAPPDVMEKLLALTNQDHHNQLKAVINARTDRSWWVDLSQKKPSEAEQYEKFLTAAFKYFKDKADNHGFQLRRARKK